MRTLALAALLLALSGCQYGAPPHVPYVTGTTYVAADGQRERLVDQHTYKRNLGITEVAPYHGGHLIADGRTFEGTVGLTSLVGGRRTELGPCATGAGAVSPDRTRVAWVTTGCPEANLLAQTVLHVDATQGDGGWTRTLETSYLYYAAGFIGEDVVLTGWIGPVRVVPEHGPIVDVPHLRYAADLHGTLVAGRHGVVNARTGRLLWYDPSAELLAFSPDGTLLVGYLYRDLVVVDARTGTQVAELPERLDNPVWEDRSHLLGTTYRRGYSAIVRVGLDGRVELATRPRRAGPQTLIFETQP